MNTSLFFRAIALIAVVSLWTGTALSNDEIIVLGKSVNITQTDIRADADSRMPQELKERFLSQPDNVARLAKTLYVRRVMAEQAKEAGLDKLPDVAPTLSALNEQAKAAGLETSPATAAVLRIAVDKVLFDAWLKKIDVENVPSEALVAQLARTTYVAKSEQFKVPEKVTVRHILLKGTDPTARSKAEQLLAEIKAGADFAALAKQHSADPGSASLGGLIGPFAKGDMFKEFQDASFAMTRKGELSEIVQSREGFHIIQFEERTAGFTRAYEDVKEQLYADIKSDLLQKARVQAAQQIEQEAQVNTKAVASIVATYKK